MLGGNLGSILYGDVSVMVDLDTPVRLYSDVINNVSHLLMAKLSRLAAKNAKFVKCAQILLNILSLMRNSEFLKKTKDLTNLCSCIRGFVFEPG